MDEEEGWLTGVRVGIGKVDDVAMGWMSSYGGGGRSKVSSTPSC